MNFLLKIPELFAALYQQDPTFREQPCGAHVPAFKSTEFQDQGILVLESKRAAGEHPAPIRAHPALLCSPGAASLSSPCWGQVLVLVVVLVLLVPGHPSISDFRALCPNFSSPGLLKYFVYLAAVVLIVPKLVFSY